jgi:hypothetical protein
MYVLTKHMRYLTRIIQNVPSYLGESLVLIVHSVIQHIAAVSNNTTFCKGFKLHVE